MYRGGGRGGFGRGGGFGDRGPAGRGTFVPHIDPPAPLFPQTPQMAQCRSAALPLPPSESALVARAAAMRSTLRRSPYHVRAGPEYSEAFWKIARVGLMPLEISDPRRARAVRAASVEKSALAELDKLAKEEELFEKMGKPASESAKEARARAKMKAQERAEAAKREKERMEDEEAEGDDGVAGEGGDDLDDDYTAKYGSEGEDDEYGAEEGGDDEPDY
eukprot:m51a1_g13806 hypothetical protein (219) ;mRNA; f:390063-390851